MENSFELAPSHTCVDRPTLPCDACDNVRNLAEHQVVIYTHRRTMSIPKPTQEELNQWDGRLAEEGLSNRRGESHRIVYGSDDRVRRAEISWSEAKNWIKQKRQQTEHVCPVCRAKFLGRADAKCCPGKSRCRMSLLRMKGM
jgi:hypothetical protein